MNKKAIIIGLSAFVILAIGAIVIFLVPFSSNDYAAKVNGVEISHEKVDEELLRMSKQYEAQGIPIPADKENEFRTVVIENLITREVLRQKSESYELSDEEIDAQIEVFRTPFNDEETFLSALTEQGYDMDSFRAVMAEDLKIQKMLEDQIQEITELPDEDILNFYNENPAYFKEPERVHASHILVKLENSESEEERERAQTKAERLLVELNNGADFNELAIAESEGPSAPQGGDLGEFTRGQMVPEFETAAFELQSGEISGIVESQFGLHIIKVHEKYEESLVDLDSVKDSISDFLLQEKNQNQMTEFLDALKEEAKIQQTEL